ncbi:unnamed protein product [Cuscuta campestris]|uniref:Integrase catalytic domain-containing protein n=1 Tax=Cuscuta campestris TaxID=132261 RepID=A0A484MWN0_9ASTE|nr:unnamed protein product [Cuscuta campestris]
METPKRNDPEQSDVQDDDKDNAADFIRHLIGEELVGVNKRLHSLGKDMEACQAENNSLKTEQLILKQAVSATARTGMDVAPSKIKVPEPKHFDGARNAKELENFLWDMEEYFKAAKIPEGEKVSIASMYLMGDAKLWWRGRVIDDANSGRMGIESWEGLKKELKTQFLPHNVSWMARENLKKLKQTGSLREYAELRRLAVKDLPTAMAEAESLVDFKTMAPQGKKGDHPKKEGKAKFEGKTKFKKKGGDGKAPAEGRNKEKAQAGGCWTCGGDHFQRNCPKGPKINSMVEEATGVSNSVPARCSPLQLMSAMNESAQNFVNRGLMYVLVVVNGVELLAMIDTGASHNFVTERLIGRLQLKLEGNSSMIKTVNAAAKEVTGRAYVKIKVGEWQGECSLTVLPLDDFDLILGNEFLIMVKAAVFPYLGGMMINDERSPSFVKGRYADQKQEHKGLASCSAMQLKRGVRSGYQTYLAVMMEIKEGVFQDVLDKVAELLEEFSDVMPPELPKKLPPKRAVDHRIELKPAKKDPKYQKLVEQVTSGIVRRYWLEDGLLFGKGGRLYVPEGDLRVQLLRETHDPQWAGHPGVTRMMALLSRDYVWPKMEHDVEAYVRTCLVCQQDKVEKRKEAVLLQPLPILERPWQSVSMDFISGFPKVNGMSTILVVVDRFSKYGVFIAAPDSCPAEKTVDLFYRNVVKYFGLPEDIVSDRDTRFTGRFWTSLFKLLGSSLKFSTANHQQRISSKAVHRGLVPKYDGPFEVMHKVGEVAYRLKLPERLKVHPTFHVSFLKRFNKEEFDASRQQLKRAPPTIREQFDKGIEKIWEHKTKGQSKKNRRTEYLVQWEGGSKEDSSWVRDVKLWQFEDKIEEYWRGRDAASQAPTRTSDTPGGGGMSGTGWDSTIGSEGRMAKVVADPKPNHGAGVTGRVGQTCRNEVAHEWFGGKRSWLKLAHSWHSDGGAAWGAAWTRVALGGSHGLAKDAWPGARGSYQAGNAI